MKLIIQKTEENEDKQIYSFTSDCPVSDHDQFREDRQIAKIIFDRYHYFAEDPDSHLHWTLYVSLI